MKIHLLKDWNIVTLNLLRWCEQWKFASQVSGGDFLPQFLYSLFLTLSSLVRSWHVAVAVVVEIVGGFESDGGYKIPSEPAPALNIDRRKNWSASLVRRVWKNKHLIKSFRSVFHLMTNEFFSGKTIKTDS